MIFGQKNEKKTKKTKNPQKCGSFVYEKMLELYYAIDNSINFAFGN